MELLIDNLGKRYKDGVWGLRGFSLTLDSGILGVVGPVGAGKTTLMRMLATVMPATEGKIVWNGEDAGTHPYVLRRVLGYLPQEFGSYVRLSGRQFLFYVAALKGLGKKASRSRVAEALAKVGLSAQSARAVIEQKMGTYSNDVQRRIGLAQALLNEPRLLLVDEPGAALAPQERARFYDLLGTLAEQRIVVVAADSISDVASIARSVVLLKKGRLISHTRPAELVRLVKDRVWSVVVDQNALVEMKRRYLISHMERQGGRAQLRIVSSEKPRHDAMLVEPTLEDAYTSIYAGGEVHVKG